MNKTLIAIAAGMMVFGVMGCVNRAAQDQAVKTAKTLADPSHAVTVQPAGTATLTDTVEVTGDVTASEDTTIGAKTPGKVVAVYVKDGDLVSAGQLLAQLDTTSLVAQLQQADAQVAQAMASATTSQSSLSQAIKNANIGPMKTSAAVHQAEAQVAAAKAALAKAQNGARPEERKQAEANVASAKSTLDTQTKELNRIKTLVSQGALAGNRLDQQQNAVDTARGQYDNAVAALALIRNGTRTEDIQAAEEQVRVAQGGLKTAQAQKDLDPLLQDQIDTAKAQVANSRGLLSAARAAVAIARQAIEDAQIRAPFAGKVSGRPIQPGTIAGNGTAIARIVGESGIYLNGQLPSVEVSKIRTGMPVEVKVDALSGKTYHGMVAAISPGADGIGRLFDVRIQFADGMSELRPGMFARASIQTKVVSNATVVPDSAVQHDGDQAYVLTAEGTKAKRQNVTTGLRQDSKIEVKGIPAGASVIVRGQEGLADGAPIKVDTSAAAKTEGTSKEG